MFYIVHWCQMDKLTVVQSNDLVAASYRLDIDEMRLINLALTKIDSRKPNIGKIEIYPTEFADMFNLNPNMIWRNMKKSVIGLMQKPIKLQFKDESGRPKERVLAWLLEANYYTNQDDCSKIEVEFSSKIEPYLFELQSNFTKVNFEYASRLTTPFSFRLYQWLIREHRIKTGQYYELTMTLEQIKISAQLDNSYTRWVDFKKRMIDPAISAINQKTNLSVSYSTTKQGKAIHTLTFVYIDESTGSLSEPKKPIRPRLQRRPKVKVGSHEEGEWQQTNLQLLRQYQDKLRTWDSAARLTMPDLKKLIEYSKLFDQVTHDVAVEELKQRTKK